MDYFCLLFYSLIPTLYTRYSFYLMYYSGTSDSGVSEKRTLYVRPPYKDTA